MPRLEYNNETKQYWGPIAPTVLNTASKIHLFQLNEMEKVVYLDADSFFLTSPDELFNYPDGAMYNEDNMGFSGLFTCIPMNHSFKAYQNLLQNFAWLDGDLLANIWFPFKTNEQYRIPYEWFANICSLSDNITPDMLKGVHFCNVTKPWNYTDAVQYMQDLQERFPQNLNMTRTAIVEKYINEYVNPLKSIFDNK